MKKLHEIRSQINKIRKEDNQPLMDKWDELADYINTKWPAELKGKNKNRVYNVSISEDKAKEVIHFFTQNIESASAKKIPRDVDEHIYLHVPGVSKVHVPRLKLENLTLKEKKQLGPGAFVAVQIHPRYRTVDLHQYREQFNSEFTMRQCADYIMRIHSGAIELNLDQYNRAHNIVHKRTTAEFYNNPMGLTAEEREARKSVKALGLKTKK